ncbi:MAG: glucose-6-phosphate isomerase [Gammaproteobacteria bacterium]|nr:glucose-6-phosphate isomerase [Gammaproteobacteria bacterium]
MSNSLLETLKHKQRVLASTSLRTLLSSDRSDFFLSLGDLVLDGSKNLVDVETLQLLVEWAKTKNLFSRIQDLAGGAIVNLSEQRPALHMALRGGSAAIHSKLIKNELDKMEAFVHKCHTQELLGSTGRPLQTIVNLGVGGSDLGASLCLEALEEYRHPNMTSYCISSLDGIYLHRLLQKLNFEQTLFVLSSKSFQTEDTLILARTVREWLREQTGKPDAWRQHFVGVSANAEAMEDFGILKDRQFYLWDWVGGRYSISSAMGLPVALAFGMDRFLEMLEGIQRVDQHFQEAPFEQNIPVMMGLLAAWNVGFWGAQAHVILPYDERLQKLPAYLAQLEMESLGKSVTEIGEAVRTTTSPFVFGEVGMKAEHSFFQLLHQGTRFFTTDFIAVATQSLEQSEEHHRLTLAHCLAQGRALALGVTEEEVTLELKQKGVSEGEKKRLLPHKIHSGNRPSNTILLRQLTPSALGMLLACYEHKVFVQSVLWGINPFDQWGVELGKRLSQDLKMTIMEKEFPAEYLDASTRFLLETISSSHAERGN